MKVKTWRRNLNLIERQNRMFECSNGGIGWEKVNERHLRSKSRILFDWMKANHPDRWIISEFLNDSEIIFHISCFSVHVSVGSEIEIEIEIVICRDRRHPFSNEQSMNQMSYLRWGETRWGKMRWDEIKWDNVGWCEKRGNSSKRDHCNAWGLFNLSRCFRSCLAKSHSRPDPWVSWRHVTLGASFILLFSLLFWYWLLIS
jgi:hypothetical protein